MSCECRFSFRTLVRWHAVTHLVLTFWFLHACSKITVAKHPAQHVPAACLAETSGRAPCLPGMPLMFGCLAVFGPRSLRFRNAKTSDCSHASCMLVVFCKPILDRGTRDYGMCDVNKASQCEHQATFKIVIAHSVVTFSPGGRLFHGSNRHLTKL